MMPKLSILLAMKNIIEKAEYGTVFVASDFAEISENAKIGVSLSRLEEEGIIRRVLHGVYYKPEYSSFLCEYIVPSADNVAHAIARNFGWTIVPCGDTALNLLGLSTQVPAVWLYVSDGAYKEYSYNKTVIRFKRTTNKEISKLSYKTALVVQAIKAIGKEKITYEDISRITKQLSAVEKDKMLVEAKAVTSWVYEIIKDICRGNK